jgi:choline dehydrogenase-like flavoprotein
MVWARGTAEDYDRWGQLWGTNSSWTWEGLLPYFKKVHLDSGSPQADMDILREG